MGQITHFEPQKTRKGINGTLMKNKYACTYMHIQFLFTAFDRGIAPCCRKWRKEVQSG